MQTDNAKLNFKQKKSRIDINFEQDRWNTQLKKIFLDLNLFFRTIDNNNFRELLLMLKSEMTLVHRIKLVDMLTKNYVAVRNQIKQDLKKSRRVHLALNAWSSPYKMTYLSVLIYWMSFNFEYHEQLIEFSTLNVVHEDAQLLTELMKLLNFFEIKKKLFEIIIDNASNNSTLKNELKRVMNRRDFRWERKENFIACLTHVINLIAKTFIEIIDSQVINDNFIISLKDD